jgi:predicted lipid carrier protein YhbT
MRDFDFDPQRALEAVRRLAADAPAVLADGFGRVVRDVPDQRLEQVMRSPARRAVLDGIFWQMPRQLDTAQAQELDTTIRWVITGRGDGGQDVYHLQVQGGQGRVVREKADLDPRLTITLDGVEFLRLVSGNSDPMQAYFTGRIELTGDVMVAAKLAQLFRMPGDNGDGTGDGGASPD